MYNILGLGKRNLALVLFWETLIIGAITLLGGLFCGILFSKLAELALIKIMDGTVNFIFTVEKQALVWNVVQFTVIYLILFLNTMRQVHVTNPIQLLRSENIGEKPPKGNMLLTLLGAGILACAYYLAVTIENPVTALSLFFVAVVMVVIATYLLFVAGSVTLCRLLQKNTRYYYKTNHFVSVSSMVYRMKRNGAGLASICILCTMVLVMVSSTVCLYAGAEESLRRRYPRNVSVDVSVDHVAQLQRQQIQDIKGVAEKVVHENGSRPESLVEYRSMDFGGILDGKKILCDASAFQTGQNNYEDIWQIFLVPVSDYNQQMGEEELLESGEALIYTTKDMKYEHGTIQIGQETWKIKGQVSDFVDNGVDSAQIFPTLYLFIPDFDTTAEKMTEILQDENGKKLSSLHWYYAFDLSCSGETQMQIKNEMDSRFAEMFGERTDQIIVQTESVEEERADFYGMYGGLFFLGVLLGIAFIFAAVLIIYYKQICEGYEDQTRFEIMQKIGMTKAEIRRSINSQILTVFFMPLVTAGVHLAFAFPLVRKMLLLFGLSNTPFLICVTGVCYLIFALFYLAVYWGTSRSYFAIVSGMRV